MPRYKDLETGEPIYHEECIFIINPELEKTLLDAIVNRYKKLARSFQGHMKSNVWGERKLAYPIIKRDKIYNSGYYVQLIFDSTADQEKDFEIVLNTDDTILKHICVRHDPDFEYEDDPEESEQPDLYPNVKSTKKPVDVFNLIFKIEEGCN